MNASWMIGYQFSTGYPVGMMLGVNNIAYSNWGVYFNWRGNWVGETKSAEELGEVYDISQYIYSSLSFGATLSASKYAYLYGGMGWASKQAEQLPSYNKVSMGAGFNVEAGVIIRPIRWVGASIGYSGSFGKYSHNQLTFGVFLFLQKK